MCWSAYPKADLGLIKKSENANKRWFRVSCCVICMSTVRGEYGEVIIKKEKQLISNTATADKARCLEDHCKEIERHHEECKTRELYKMIAFVATESGNLG